jgi:hypothetical protein
MAINKRKSRKATKILLIISSIFGLLVIAGAIYFYTLKDVSPKDSSANQIYCGCYYLDPLVNNTCGDSRQGFNFKLSSAPETSTCSAECSTSELNTSYLNSSTEQADYLVCQVQNVSDERCTDMDVLTDEGQIVTGKVTTSDTLEISATFDEIYSNYVFYVNSEPLTADSVSVDQKTITKTINVADYSDVSSLEIKASAKDSQEQDINAEACHRLIEITGEGEINVSRLAFETTTDSDNVGYRYETALIDVGNLPSSENLKVVFSFDKTSIADLTMTDGISASTSSGRITIQETDLYLSSNFEEDKNFNVLEDITGDLVITATVYQGTTNLGSADTTIEIPIPDDTTDDSSTDSDSDDADTTDDTSTDETSYFSVTKACSPSCVERVEGNNLATFTITITNPQEISDDISSVLDKLPLGFTYVEDSSEINNQSISDDDYISLETVGDSQEITWEAENGWSIAAEDEWILTFDALAGDAAITGENQNEVVVTPVNTPDDPTDLRAEAVIQVAQDCTSPDTGILDISIVKILIGFMIISTGYFIYNSPKGSELAHAVTKTSSYKSVRKAGIKIFRPKTYFEEKLVEKLEKKKKK